MKSLLKLAFFFFHPVWIPCMGTALYFKIIPRFFPDSIIKAKLFAVFILTMLLPLVFIYLLINLNLAKTIHLDNQKARRLFILCIAIVLTLLNNLIINHEMVELFYFFTGILLTAGIIFFTGFSNLKLSLHVSWMAGLLGFMIGLSLMYSINLLWLIAALLFCIGWVASNRVLEEEHSISETAWSFVSGILPQLLLFGIAFSYYKI